MKNDHEIQYPSYIARLGTWPLNFGLFFLYNTIVNLGLSLVAAAFYTAKGITDPNIVVAKTQGLAVIGLLLTLGITLIFSSSFYVHKIRIPRDDDHEAEPIKDDFSSIPRTDAIEDTKPESDTPEGTAK